jgi:hypothetical protein
MTTTEPRRRVADAEALGYWPADWPLPSVITDTVLRLVLGISEATFYRWKKAQRFHVLEVQEKTIAAGTRYSGTLVDRYRHGTWTYAQTFGAGRRRS